MAALAAACGAGEPAPVALAGFTEAATQAVCDWAVACRHMPDEGTCRLFVDPKDYDTRRAEDAVAGGRLGYDPLAAGRCLESVRDGYCLAVPFSDLACEDLFAGLVAEGGACTSDFECAAGAPCEVSSCTVQCCTGTCGPAPVPPAEPPALAEVGEACAGHDDCAEGAYCDFDRTCAAMPDAEGERCVFGCARGDLYCDTDLLQCRRYAGLGEPCDEARPCDPAWSHCDGACRLRPRPGEPCAPQTMECVAAAFCDAGTCRARGGPGAPCDDPEQCTVTCDSTPGQCVEYQRCEP